MYLYCWYLWEDTFQILYFWTWFYYISLNSFCFWEVLYDFLTPPALPEVPEAWFNVQQTYSLSSLAFKRVTSGSVIIQFISDTSLKSSFTNPLLQSHQVVSLTNLTAQIQAFPRKILLSKVLPECCGKS